MKAINITAKYSPKKYVKIIFMILIMVGFLLTIGRWYSSIDNRFVLINIEIHSHISNLSLSMIFYLGIGYSWLLFGVKFRFIMFLGIFLIIANFICETLMGFMNTTDIVDAVYGTIGILIVFVFLTFVDKYGLISND